MAAVPWLEEVQGTLFDQYGEDMITVDPTFSTNFTFANGEEERSFGKITIPMFLGGIAGKLSCTGLDKAGSALLGMTYMHGMGWCIDFETGRCVIKELEQHFGLSRLMDIFNHSAVATPVKRNRDALRRLAPRSILRIQLSLKRTKVRGGCT